MQIPSEYLARIKALDPQADVTRAVLNSDGLMNDVILVDDHVYRFAKSPGPKLALANEAILLRSLEGRLPVAVPTVLQLADDLMVVRRIPGRALTTGDVDATLAAQLGEALDALHIIDDPQLPASVVPAGQARQLALWTDIRAYVYPLLLPHQRAWAERLAAYADDPTAFAYTPCLIHGDLAPYHLFMQAGKLTGVIDFGVGGLGDPAIDISALLVGFGPRLVEGLRPTYPALDALLPRARYYAAAIELEWVMLGLKHNEKFWFTAHLGNARQ